jgi:CRP-like cAMP-binding protein
MPFKKKEIRMPGNLLKFDIGSKEIETLKKLGKMKVLPKGECLLLIGSVPDTVCVLLEGTADMLAQDSSGDLFSVRPVGTGELVGLTEFIANLPCDSQIHAVTECTVTRVTQGDLIEFLKAEPDICLEIASAIARTLHESIRGSAMYESD